MFFKKNCPQDCAEDTIAIAHDNDLQLIKNVVRNNSKCRSGTSSQRLTYAPRKI